MKLEDNGELLVVDFTGVEVRVGEADLARMFVERIRSAAEFNSITAEQLLAPRPIDLRTLPEIGSAWEEGIYAGLTVHRNIPMALVLLPNEKERINWADAGAWAETQGGVLPSRGDMLILFENARDQFNKDGWYWTDTVHPVYADSAFIQFFGFGGQYDDRKDLDCRARAVRRVAI